MGIIILRLSIAVGFLLTSWHIFRDPHKWAQYIQPWEKKFIFMSAETCMKLIGLLDLVIGLWLVTPWFTWVAALIAFCHMITVVMSVGIKGPEYRDISILGGSLALFLLTLPIYLF